MTSEIIPTLSCCIDSIQLKLSDFGMEKIDFDDVLIDRFQGVDTPRNVNQRLNLLDDDHFDFLNPVCPDCNCKNFTKQGFQERNPIIDNPQPLKVYLQKYQCKSCGRKFVTSLDSVIEPGHRYAKIFKEKLNNLIKTGARSLRKITEDFQNFFGVFHHTKPYKTGCKSIQKPYKIKKSFIQDITAMMNNISGLTAIECIV